MQRQVTLLGEEGPFALLGLVREWDRLAASGCQIHVAAREASVVADLERLRGTPDWELHSSSARALRALLSTPVD